MKKNKTLPEDKTQPPPHHLLQEAGNEPLIAEDVPELITVSLKGKKPDADPSNKEDHPEQ